MAPSHPNVTVRRYLLTDLRAYAGRAASRAVWAFLRAIKPEASWSRARWFSSFFDQRIRIARLRLSHEWAASTTQRRARQRHELAAPKGQISENRPTAITKGLEGLVLD